MASIKLILRKHQADQSGHCPLYIRIIKDRKTKFITAGVKLKENEWDEAKQKVKKNHPNSARMNAALSQKIADAEGQVADLERKVKSISINKIKDAIKGKDVPNFFEYADKKILGKNNSIAFSTKKNYEKYIRKFKNFVGTNDLCFDEITISLLMDYINYMANERMNKLNTQKHCIQILATIFKKAINEEVIPEHMFPFSKIKIKRAPSKRQFLKKDQIDAIINYSHPLVGKKEIYKDMFVFSIFAGGLRFSDVFELKVKHFDKVERKIMKVILKTNRVHNFKIGLQALDIINKYINDNSNPEDYVFPLNRDNFRYDKEPSYKFHIIAHHSKWANKCLDEIAKKLEIPTKISFHISRHTFATNALNNGMRIEHVSKLLDHSDIRTTQIYAKIISEELDKAVDSFIY